LKKVSTFNASLLAVTLYVLVSCATQPTINGLWQGTKEIGTIEFRATGKVIIVDNMSATVTGFYQLKNNGLINFELTASDIFRDSIQPSPKTVITAKIIKLNDDQLQLRITGDNKIKNYSRIH
jgi:hypothetical protein